ncbi:MAG TPA: VanZ family protein [Candidatus Paceibacterota bacterium]|nr:VanZ family protein [Candidatus Paceibacterota bacterium]
MRTRLVPALLLALYGALLAKVMVFKDVPLIRIGRVMVNFGGTDASGSANLVPFSTILPYLLGYKGLMIAGINLAGNVALLVPIGFLAPFIHRAMTWRQSLTLGAFAGLAIEIPQSLLRVGVFDIDDVILNAFGVLVGYWVHAAYAKWIRPRVLSSRAVRID